MYLGDVARDNLTLENAKSLPGAKLFRGPDGRLMMRYAGDVYVWNQTPGGLAGIDGWFSKITKPFKKVVKVVKKVHKPLRKVLSKGWRLHKKITAPVRKVVKKYAGVIAPVAAFIPVVGWAVAAALTVVAIKEKKKKAKSAAEAAELENQLQQAEMDAEQKRLEAEEAGYAKEYEAELARQMQAQQQTGFAYAPGGGGAMFAPASSGGGGAMGYRGGGEEVAPDVATMKPIDEPAAQGFDAKKLIIPAAIGVAALLLLKRK